MTTLRVFQSPEFSIHPAAAWYLADLGEFRGKQELYTRQSPQRLKVLREHALIESAVSSNRIEGVALDASRVRDVLVAPKPLFRDRDEEEVRGYRDALDWLHREATSMEVSEENLRRLHAMARGEIWDAGQYKEKDGDIVERYPDGRERVRFRPVAAARTGEAMAALARVPAEFTIAELERACPGVSRDMIRTVLREQQAEGGLSCVGRGPAARWLKKR